VELLFFGLAFAGIIASSKKENGTLTKKDFMGRREIYTSIGADSERYKISVDFSKYRLLLLLGQSGSGKSIFHNYLYEHLTRKYSSEEIGFVFLDMTRVDFYDWDSPYIIAKEVGLEKSIEILEKLIKSPVSTRHIFIHIEECDLFVSFPERIKSIIDVILKHPQGVTIIYSTSRLGGKALPAWLLDRADMKVIFETPDVEFLKQVTGNNVSATPKHWEKMVIYDSKRIGLVAFTDSEVKVLRDFRLRVL
jgi:ABC-type dipeptide/oligopeptide/nickel transport system ATPase component